MSTKRLTERNVTTLEIKSKAYRRWDDKQPGLAVLVLPSGVRTYYCHWNYTDGPSRAFAIGRVGDIDLEEARDKVRDARRLAKQGNDPRSNDPKRTESFKALVELWTLDQVAEQFGSAEVTKVFLLNATKPFHDRPAGTIAWPEIKKLLSDKRTDAPHAANRLHGHLGSFFKWAVTNKLLTASPMFGQKKPAKSLVRARRDYAWFKGEAGDAAIVSIWRAADDIGGEAGKFIKLCLVLGKRRGAIERMRWEQIEQSWWWNAKPGSEIKRLHSIPLPWLAQRIMSPRGEGRVLGHVNALNIIRRVRKLTGIKNFIFHGLRHLVETKLAELKVQPHIRDQLLDHAWNRGAGAGYDHHAYREEMLDALESWCAHIEKLIGRADNVAILK